MKTFLRLLKIKFLVFFKKDKIKEDLYYQSWAQRPTQKTYDSIKWTLSQTLPEKVNVLLTKDLSFGDIQTNLPIVMSKEVLEIYETWDNFFEAIQYVAPFESYQIKNNMLTFRFTKKFLYKALDRIPPKPWYKKLFSL
jgi:hypothetical protein